MFTFPITLFGTRPATITFLQASTPISGLHSTATFSNVNIGPEANDRLVAMVMTAGVAAPDRSLSSVTIGGVTPSTPINFTSVIPLASTTLCAISTRLITSGTTATYSATFSGTVSATFLHTYVLRGLSSTTPVTTASAASNASVDSISTSIDVPAAGVILMAGATRQVDISLTGANKDAQSTSGTFGMATGSLQNLLSQTGRSLAASLQAPSTMNAVLAAATWN